jgi:ribose transport system ATP-binding protein
MSALLEMRDIEKIYPGVRALQGVTLEVDRGEVRALLGENGAGKSTLMKILAGAVDKSAGGIRIDGEDVEIRGPRHARELGVAIIYQELSILPHLSVAENIFLGRLPKRRNAPWLVDWRLCHEMSADLLKQVGLAVDPRTPASRLKIAEQQMAEIAKAISEQAKIVIMDEPTTSLTAREVDTLFGTVRNLRRRGVSVIYVSHRLAEVKAVCDRATVLRDGTKIGDVNVATSDARDWVRMMVGRDLNQLFPKTQVAPGPAQISVRNLSSRRLKDISFSAHAGEILGIAGLVGSGRSTLARTLFGDAPSTSGEILMCGEVVKIDTPAVAISHGLALVPEDRKGQGLVLPMNVRENITLASLDAVSEAGQLRIAKERRVALRFVDMLKISTPHIEQKTLNLSGGNQQKVVLAKWLYTDAKVLIIDEPTRGIDVGAKVEIYSFLQRLVEQGKCVIMISSELPELIGMSDRILVMREGRLSGELQRPEFSEERIMAYASGVEH